MEQKFTGKEIERINTELYEELINVLRQDERFFTEEGLMLKNKIYEATMQMDGALIRILSENELLKKKFFVEVNEILVFDKILFGWVINNKEFLPNSFTKYKNKIGLVNKEGDFIVNSNDIEIVFPYKDCVLEGGHGVRIDI